MANNDHIIQKLRDSFAIVEDKFTNCALIFAYNGTGKTRLSYDFAHYNREEGSPKHTLYYNAYTEDLFTWDNDLDNNTKHHLLINTDSALIQGLAGYNFTESLSKYLSIFTDIDFHLNYAEKGDVELPVSVSFSKHFPDVNDPNKIITIENIKVSRGEERLFVWCFFRCIIEYVLKGEETYKDIEYIYIDDPISSLDDNNVIAFAEQLYTVIREEANREHDAAKAGQEFHRIKFIISSHHALFFHTMLHGLERDNKLGKFYLSRSKDEDAPTLKDMSDDTPFYYNVAMMSEIQKAIAEDKLYTYHFTILRSIMEKIKEFFGHWDYRYILSGITYRGERFNWQDFDTTEFYSRVMNVLTHQGSMFTPARMNEDNKELLKTLFYFLKKKYTFILPHLDDERNEYQIYKDNH